MADDPRPLRVILERPQTPPMSKWEKAAIFVMGAFLVWEILTGPSHRRRG